MQQYKGLNLFLEVFVVITVLGSLTAISLPYIGKLADKGRTESRLAELHNIQTAVLEMLSDSHTGTLKETSPTADMSQVKTTDQSPIFLSDYLQGLRGTYLISGYRYAFAANGTVTQEIP
jgi:hypothetical protein